MDGGKPRDAVGKARNGAAHNQRSPSRMVATGAFLAAFVLIASNSNTFFYRYLRTLVMQERQRPTRPPPSSSFHFQDIAGRLSPPRPAATSPRPDLLTSTTLTPTTPPPLSMATVTRPRQRVRRRLLHSQHRSRRLQVRFHKITLLPFLVTAPLGTDWELVGMLLDLHWYGQWSHWKSEGKISSRRMMKFC